MACDRGAMCAIYANSSSCGSVFAGAGLCCASISFPSSSQIFGVVGVFWATIVLFRFRFSVSFTVSSSFSAASLCASCFCFMSIDFCLSCSALLSAIVEERGIDFDLDFGLAGLCVTFLRRTGSIWNKRSPP